MYQRGDRVVVEGFGGRRAVLRVWEDRGRGLCLSSEAGYQRALAGDEGAPLVGYPRRDIKGYADAMSESSTEQPQPAERSPIAPQG